MKLLWARIENFKLLEDVEVEFSVDPKRPLTVIRAENGSGKTSLMFALSWGLFGERGLPSDAQQLRLISSSAPAGTPVTVRVAIEFENWTAELGSVRYRLTRSVDQTPRDGTDNVSKGTESVRLERLDPEGNKLVDPEQLHAMLPPRLKDVFFTNGDDVQSFVAGTLGQGHQQDHVKEVLRVLLGIDRVEDTVKDLGAVARKLRNEAARLGGQDLQRAEDKLRGAEEKKAALRRTHDDLLEKESKMRAEYARIEKELGEIRGVGNVEELSAEIKRLDAESKRLLEDRKSTRNRMRRLMASQDVAWGLGGAVLERGLTQLNDLADKKVIPGVSVQVLHDRLDLGTCICGEALDAGSPDGARRRRNVETVIVEQQVHTEVEHRQTGVWHQARAAHAELRAKAAQGQTVWADLDELVIKLTTIREDLEGKAAAKKAAEDKRQKIDDQRIQELTTRRTALDAKITSNTREQGRVGSDLSRASAEYDEAKSGYDVARVEDGKSDALGRRAGIAADLESLASGILDRLKKEYVDKIAARTSDMFLEIVGSSPEFESAVFTGVAIDAEALQIVVQTRNGRSLDPAFEVNGASQRALTLAFIWAVTEVSGTTAPRIIDSPLGMVAGGVKTRMVEAITAPTKEDTQDYQVVLLLTRSEIRDIEDLLEQRSGAFNTLSCSKDYPTDLRFDWGTTYPVVRACRCDHRHSCETCARRIDGSSNVIFVPRESSASA